MSFYQLRLLAYLRQCIKIIHWLFLKPISYQKWLTTIHPKLNISSFWLIFHKEIKQDFRIKHYFQYVYGTIIIASWGGSIVIGGLIKGITEIEFDWYYSFAFLLPYSFVMSLFIPTKAYIKKLLIILFFIILFSLLINTMPVNIRITKIIELGVVFGVIFGMIGSVGLDVLFGVVFCIAFGMAGSVAESMVLGVAFGVVLGVALGVALGVVLSLTFGVALGVVLSLAVSMVGGLVEGVIFSIAFGITYIIGILRLYFWLPELLHLLYLRFIIQDASRTLHALPVYYDEAIYLPLPFMPQLISEAYIHHPEHARATITHIITNTNQQKVAAKAMLNIAVYDLQHCTNTEDIRALPHRLAWLHASPPDEIAKPLQSFIDISEDTNKALQSPSLYHRHRDLDKPISQLNTLQKSLAFQKSAKLATGLSTACQHWLKILQQAKNDLDTQAKASAEIPQAYIAGQPLNPRESGSAFKGRIDLFAEIEHITTASQAPVLCLQGGRRTGKTSLLKYLPTNLGAELRPILIDLQGASSVSQLHSFADYIINTIRNEARQHYHYDNLPNTDKEALKDDPFYYLQNWLNAVADCYPEKRWLLCFDEFERLNDLIDQQGKAPLNFLRNLVQHHPRYLVLFSGSHRLEDLPAYWSDTLINTRRLPISYLHPSDAENLITQPVEDFPDLYPAEVVDALIHWTRCQPYFVQLLCYSWVELLNREKRQRAHLNDLPTIIERALETGGGYFNEFWQTTLNEEKRQFVLKMVQDDNYKGNNPALIERLIKQEVIEKQGEKFVFQVPLIQHFVKTKDVSCIS